MDHLLTDYSTHRYARAPPPTNTIFRVLLGGVVRPDLRNVYRVRKLTNNDFQVYARMLQVAFVDYMIRYDKI